MLREISLVFAFELMACIQGNNILHMCVLHSQKEMYAHIKKWCKEHQFENTFQEALLHKNNHEHQTPLLFAARLGRAQMVQHIVEDETVLLWAYGLEKGKQIKCEKVPLDLLEPRGPHDELNQGATLLAVLDRYGRKELLSEGSIAWRLAETKWHMFAEEQFDNRFRWYFVIICLHLFSTLFWPMFRETTPALGLKWQSVGPTKPATGHELDSRQLREALGRKTEFTQLEWDGFGISNLRLDHFVKWEEGYSKPAATEQRNGNETWWGFGGVVATALYGLAILIDVILFFLALYKLVHERREQIRRKDYWKVGGARKIENVGSFSGCLIHVLGCFLDYFCSICARFLFGPYFCPDVSVRTLYKIPSTFCLYSYSLFFILGHEKTGVLVVMFWNLFIEDVWNFVRVYVVAFLCFGISCFLLLEDRRWESLCGLLAALVTHDKGETPSLLVPLSGDGIVRARRGNVGQAERSGAWHIHAPMPRGCVLVCC